MGVIPKPGQKNIPIDDWKRFLRMADWFERTIEQGKGVVPATAGQAFLVLTPAGGIAARKVNQGGLGGDDVIYSATCIKCVAVEHSGVQPFVAGEKTIHKVDEELLVYNYLEGPITGNTYVNTALSPNGTRYVETPRVEWEWGTLDDELVVDGPAAMSVFRGDPLVE